MFDILVVSLVLLSIYYYYKTKEKKQYKNFYKLGTPTWYPIIGNAYILLGRNILKAVQYAFQTWGNPMYLYIPYRTFMTAKVEDIKIILNHPSSMEKSREYNHLRGFVGKSLLIEKVPRWKKNRRIISRSFKQTILDEFMDTFYNKTCTLVDLIKKERYSNNDVIHLFGKFTLDTFCEATLGIESTILEDTKEHMFVTAIRELQQIAFNRIGNLIKMNDFLYQFVSDCKLLNFYDNNAKKHVRQIMTTKHDLRTKHSDAMIDVHRLPVLDLLLQVADKESLTDEYIAEEMVLFAGAATDTTAYTLTYISILLGINQDVQQKVYEEVISVVGPNMVIGSSHLGDLKYTEMVISESQRLAPAIPMAGRYATADIDLGHSIIPANTSIIMSFMELHRNPDIWPKPLEFNPDRFLPEEVAKRPQYSFVPFSGGPRNCIGLKYAMMVMKTTVANLVRNFHITSGHKSIHELDFESSIVMIPTRPLDVHFTPR
ncbi:unnamed protein product [Brassicogethes aeneus]|uniref:Cytochrome P450 n=1 Tax=Brassicogethes aeneus TaxID=1431903 RepID=A0A9P0FMP0_BRAAE|nr:unnamed protein product [Brassicogethes aeneus]